MKKILLTVMALSAFGVANAQLKFGAKAGVNLATLTGDFADDAKMKVGFNAGGLVEYKLMEKFALQAELLYSLQGAKTEDRDDYGFGQYDKSENKINLSYINIPILAKYYIVKGFHAEAGPQLGILISAKNKVEYTEVYDDGDGLVTYNESSEVDIKDNLKTVDFSFNIGLGYDFTENIFVGARYNIGLTNIYDFDDFGFGFTDYDAKNSVFSVNFGYKF